MCIYTPGSSRYVHFLPFVGRFLLMKRWISFTHKRKIYIYTHMSSVQSSTGERSHKDCCAKVAEPWLAQSHSFHAKGGWLLSPKTSGFFFPDEVVGDIFFLRAM